MRKARNFINHRKPKRCKSLYDLGYFDFEQREQATKMLEPLGISGIRPLLWTEQAVVLEVSLSGPVLDGTISNRAVLFASQQNNLIDASNVFCGWKEEDKSEKGCYCLGIMDEQGTIVGAYYQCRRSKNHRTLK